jgi:hypothetical protein
VVTGATLDIVLALQLVTTIVVVGIAPGNVEIGGAALLALSRGVAETDR